MNVRIEKIESSCPNADIAAYIDGELAPREELELERHFAVCRLCARELNRQKNLLRALDFALIGEKGIDLPENFTKTIVVNAESSVKGLRCPKERSKALFICSALFAFIMLGLGSEANAVLSTFTAFAEQLFAVGSFIGHLIYDLALVLTTILRLLGGQLASTKSFAALGAAVFLITILIASTRLMTRVSRAKL